MGMQPQVVTPSSPPMDLEQGLVQPKTEPHEEAEKESVNKCVPKVEEVAGEEQSEPTLGSAELPSIGSVGHSTGTCRPCIFVHSKGCESGVNCTFCHLCEK